MGPAHGWTCRYITQGNDDEDRDQPHRDFDLGGVRPLRRVGGAGVRRAVFPGEGEGHDDHGDHDQQHQQGGGDDQVSFIQTDLSFWVEQGPLSASQH